MRRTRILILTAIATAICLLASGSTSHAQYFKPKAPKSEATAKPAEEPAPQKSTPKATVKSVKKQAPMARVQKPKRVVAPAPSAPSQAEEPNEKTPSDAESLRRELIDNGLLLDASTATDSPEILAKRAALEKEIAAAKEQRIGLENAIASGLDRALVEKNLIEIDTRIADLEKQIQALYQTPDKESEWTQSKERISKVEDSLKRIESKVDDLAAAQAKQEEQKEPPKASPVPEAKEEKSASWFDKIKLKGDFRYRFELIKAEEKDLRYRHRIRARAGAHAAVHDSLDIVVQLGSGSSDDPVSNNQSIGSGFSSKPIWLDLVYLDWHPTAASGLKLIAGKHKNPYQKVGKSELVWDGDLTPEGITLSFRRTFGRVEPFLIGGGYWMEERKADDDGWLLGVQGGLKIDLKTKAKLFVLFGIAYYDYLNTRYQKPYYDEEDSFGNSVIEATNGDGEAAIFYEYDYNQINWFAEAGGKIGSIAVALFSDFVVNAAVQEENFGWLVGTYIGKAKEARTFQLRYTYRVIEQDAVLGLLTDSDFSGGGTGGKGHEWNFSFKVTKALGLGATYFFNQHPIEDSLDYHRVQLDTKVKF